MTDGSEKDLLMLAGTLAGFAAAVLTIFERLLNIQDRLGRRTKKSPAVDERSLASPSSATDLFEPGLLKRASYLFLYETGVIVAAGILLNYLGLTLSRHLQSILFLDMTGTALAAFLLGPWWGAIVALLSNSVVNWLLYPEAGADVVIFPWSLVNMAGGFFWGVMARRQSFRRYLKAGRQSALSHAWFLFTFGIVGAMVMSIPGTWVQAALGEQAIFALNPELAATLAQMVAQWETVVRDYLQAVVGLTWSEHLGWTLVNWFQNCIRYIPDKTFSAAIALVVLKYGYPLFEPHHRRAIYRLILLAALDGAMGRDSGRVSDAAVSGSQQRVSPDVARAPRRPLCQSAETHPQGAVIRILPAPDFDDAGSQPHFCAVLADSARRFLSSRLQLLLRGLRISVGGALAARGHRAEFIRGQSGRVGRNK
jgi:hypothetical protein